MMIPNLCPQPFECSLSFGFEILRKMRTVSAFGSQTGIFVASAASKIADSNGEIPRESCSKVVRYRTDARSGNRTVV